MDNRDSDPLWEEALELISRQVNEGTFRIWFEPTMGLGLEDGVYRVGVASPFAKDWIDSRFGDIMAEAVSQVMGNRLTSRSSSHPVFPMPRRQTRRQRPLPHGP